MAFVEKVTDLMGSLIRTVTGDDIYESDPVRVFDDEYIVEDNTQQELVMKIEKLLLL